MIITDIEKLHALLDKLTEDEKDTINAIIEASVRAKINAQTQNDTKNIDQEKHSSSELLPIGDKKYEN